ncbi:MAG: hypothetical protein AAF996_17505 [Pseudomonadota bacterium]
MADPIPFEAQAEELKLRAKPRPVTQINRKVVIVGAGVVAVLLFLAASIALDPPMRWLRYQHPMNRCPPWTTRFQNSARPSPVILAGLLFRPNAISGLN